MVTLRIKVPNTCLTNLKQVFKINDSKKNSLLQVKYTNFISNVLISARDRIFQLDSNSQLRREFDSSSRIQQVQF